MRILFFGSPLFAVPTLKALANEESVTIVRVFTQPDKPAGRGKKLTAPAVKNAALELGLEVDQPERIRGRAFRRKCQELQADAFVVVAFGKIFPGKLLAVPPMGCINLHSSLLPEYRGAAPINWAIVDGKKKTGVSTMIMEEGLDSGPVLLTEETEIRPHETTPELAERLAEIGSGLMIKTLHALSNDTLQPKPQDDSLATHAPMISKDDGKLHWNQPAAKLYNQFRGFYPWPGVFGEFRGDILKIKDMKPAESMTSQEKPGTLIVNDNRLFVVCGDATVLELSSLQLPGKRALPAADFINGTRLEAGEKLSGFFN